MLPERVNRRWAFFCAVMFTLILVGGLLEPAHLPPVFRPVGAVALSIGVTMALGLCIWWCVYHRLDKGLKYALTHARLLRQVRRALYEAGCFSLEAFDGVTKAAVTPNVKLKLSPDLMGGTLLVQNHIRYQKALENTDFSACLGKYIMESQYFTDDGNSLAVEFEDSGLDRQLTFKSSQELIDYARKFGDNFLFMDGRHKIPLSSMLLVGSTGSGKTYGLYALIFQLLSWMVKPRLYFADPKMSSLYAMGHKIAPKFTGADISEILAILRQFHGSMSVRKEALLDKLREKLDTDYSDWSFSAHILIFDEYAAFQSTLSMADKKVRDEVNMILRDIVLQGRQLGFFVWFVMQKSDSNDISTAIRDNLVWKVVLGQAESTTYMTAFGHSADLPKRRFGKGQGLFTLQGVTQTPKITSFPTLDFPILEGLEKVMDDAGIVRDETDAEDADGEASD